MSPAKQLSVLAFASTILASPFAGQGHGHAHGHMRLHTGAAPYPLPSANGTGSWNSTSSAAGISTASTVVQTATDMTTRFETLYSTVKVNQAPQSSSGADTAGSISAAAVETSAAQCGADVTVTSTEKVYVTITGGQAPSSSAPVSAAQESSPAASTPGSYGGSSSQAAPVSSSAANSAPAYSAPASSSSEAAPVSSSSSAAAYSPPVYSSAGQSSEAAPASSSSAPAYSAPASSSSEAAPDSSSAPAYSAPASSSSEAAPASTSSSSSSAAAIPLTSILPSMGGSSATSSSSAAAATSSSSSSGSGSGKRGLGYNDASLLTCFDGSSEISWAYNWESSSKGLTGFTYIPTLWGDSDTYTSSWSENAKSAISSGSTHLFSFNEPDLSAQANLSPSAAAQAYKTYMNPLSGQAKLCAPAVTNGVGTDSAPMGIPWLKEFNSACGDSCKIDCYNFHWYDSASNVDYFKEYVNNATSLAGDKPVWISEFGATGSDEEINSFLEEVMPWMDSNDQIAGYAYYMASSGLLITGTEPSTYGTTYKSYTS